MLTAEVWRPKRNQQQGVTRRRVNNGWLFISGVAVIQFIEPLAALSASVFASRHEFGLFNTLNWPLALEYLLCIVVLDAAVYLQHIATHKIPLLWSLHRVHHFDSEVDVTTALRFHPVEILLSMLYKSLWVMLLGAPLLAVLVFEITLNALAMFNHANFKLNSRLDRILRWVVVTPDMHVIHHSQSRVDSDRNYGFCLTCWDRIFSTYASQPAKGYRSLKIGQAEVASDKAASLSEMMVSPFKR